MSHNTFVCTQLNDFKYCKWLNSYIWFIYRILTGTTTQGQCGSESNGNEGVLYISQISRTGTSSSDGLGLYLDTHGESYPSAEMQSVYSTAPAEWERSLFWEIRQSKK